MSLLDILLKKDEHFIIKYLPITDFAYNYVLEEILNACVEIEDYFKNYDYVISEEHFVDYLICFELANYNKDRDYITQDYIDGFDCVLGHVNKLLKKINLSDIINFLDEQENCIIKDNKLIKIYYEFLKKNKRLLTYNILSSGLDNLWFFFIDDYKLWIDCFIENKLYKKLLHDLKIKSISRLENILGFLFLLKKKNINIGEYLYQLNEIMDFCLNDEEHILQSKHIYLTILGFYRKIGVAEANDYENKLKIINLKVDEWMVNNGSTIEYDLKLNDVIEWIKSIDDPVVQFIYYTHSAVNNNKTKRLLSFYEYAKIESEKEKPQLLNLVTNLNPETKKYNSWLQDCYSMAEIVHLNILSYAFSDEEMCKNYYDIAKLFNEKIIDGFEQKEVLLSDFNNLLMKQEKCLKELDNVVIIKDYCKMAVEYVESLLREIYYERNKTIKYIDREKYTLGILLKSEKKLYTDFFTDDFLDGLNYYLSSDVNDQKEKVGFDLRNRMKHANSISDKEYNQIFFMRISLIITVLLNEIYLIL